jgi:hypothetical protein
MPTEPSFVDINLVHVEDFCVNFRHRPLAISSDFYVGLQAAITLLPRLYPNEWVPELPKVPEFIHYAHNKGWKLYYVYQGMYTFHTFMDLKEEWRHL